MRPCKKKKTMFLVFWAGGTEPYQHVTQNNPFAMFSTERNLNDMEDMASVIVRKDDVSEKDVVYASGRILAETNSRISGA